MNKSTLSASIILAILLMIGALSLVPDDDATPDPYHEVICADLTVKNPTFVDHQLNSIIIDIIDVVNSNPRALLNKSYSLCIIDDKANTNFLTTVNFGDKIGANKKEIFKNLIKLEKAFDQVLSKLEKRYKYKRTFIIEPIINALKHKVNKLVIISDMNIVDSNRNFEKGRWLSPVKLCNISPDTIIEIHKVSSGLPHPHDNLLDGWWNEVLYCKGPKFWTIWNKYKHLARNTVTR